MKLVAALALTVFLFSSSAFAYHGMPELKSGESATYSGWCKTPGAVRNVMQALVDRGSGFATILQNQYLNTGTCYSSPTVLEGYIVKQIGEAIIDNSDNTYGTVWSMQPSTGGKLIYVGAWRQQVRV